MVTPCDQLTHLLRPAGAGLHTVSTGKAEQLDLAAGAVRGRRRGAGAGGLAAVAAASWRRRGWWCWASPRTAGRGWCGGRPSGPRPCGRRCCGQRPDFASWAPRRRGGGRRGRRRGTAPAPRRHAERGPEAVLPAGAVSDIVARGGRARCRCRRCPSPSGRWTACSRSTPAARLLVLGGDHSVAWPVVAALVRRRAPAPGDRPARRPHRSAAGTAGRALLLRHLGLSRQRPASGGAGGWSRWACGPRVGTRQHWEGTLGVRQVWAAEVAAEGDARRCWTEIVQHLRSPGGETGVSVQRHRRHRRR